MLLRTIALTVSSPWRRRSWPAMPRTRSPRRRPIQEERAEREGKPHRRQDRRRSRRRREGQRRQGRRPDPQGRTQGGPQGGARGEPDREVSREGHGCRPPPRPVPRDRRGTQEPRRSCATGTQLCQAGASHLIHRRSPAVRRGGPAPLHHVELRPSAQRERGLREVRFAPTAGRRRRDFDRRPRSRGPWRGHPRVRLPSLGPPALRGLRKLGS